MKRIAEDLLKEPSDRRTASQWSEAIGMSEKSLRRLLLNETGLSFLQWRQQFQLIVAVRALREGNERTGGRRSGRLRFDRSLQYDVQKGHGRFAGTLFELDI